MFVEKKIETVIKTAVVTAVDGLLSSTITYRSNFAEGTYGDGDEDKVFPMIWIFVDPAAKPAGQEPTRIVPVNIHLATNYNDDKDRTDLSLMYETVRNLMETETWNFGANISYTNDSWEMPSPGSVEIDGQEQSIIFSFELTVCATNFKWTE